MKLGLTIVRAVIGLLFVGHGTQKLFGWFGGHGREGTAQFFESLGLRPGPRNAVAAGTSEALGGALLATGLLTPLGAAMITGTMATAIRTVHAQNGPWVTNSGYEYNLVLIAALFALTDVGPGHWSLDHALDIERSGPGWALAELAAGLAGTAAVTRGAQQAGGQPSGAADVPGDPAMATA